MYIKHYQELFVQLSSFDSITKKIKKNLKIFKSISFFFSFIENTFLYQWAIYDYHHRMKNEPDFFLNIECL